MARVVAHLDLDAFFAAVEVLERPELAGLPLVVGGDPHGRGVVATASYEARRYGIRSAMSAAEARRRCPEAIFVRPDHARYSRHSRAVWELVAGHVDLVEQVGIDEGYLDLTAIVATAHEAERFLESLGAAIRERCALSASFGCGTSKVIAKVASDFRKPAGITVVPAGREAAFLAPLPLRALPGIGPRADERLRAAGLTSIGELAGLADDQLARLIGGAVGRELRDRALGKDSRAVTRPGRAGSIGYEETFDVDIGDAGRLREEARRMAAEVAARLARRGACAQTVTVKVRYPDFRLASRSQTARAPFASADEIGRLALVALDRALADRQPPLRLLGVTVSKLVPTEQLRLPLAETDGERLTGLRASPE